MCNTINPLLVDLTSTEVYTLGCFTLVLLAYL